MHCAISASAMKYIRAPTKRILIKQGLCKSNLSVPEQAVPHYKINAHMSLDTESRLCIHTSSPVPEF